MKKTGAWLVRFALEQIGVRHTFGIPGVHNTEIYDELNNSESIEPLLVTHEGGGAFMADAVSRVSNSIGTLLHRPGRRCHSCRKWHRGGIFRCVPMLVIAGGVRSDSEFKYQLHDMDQHALLKPITKATFKISHQNEILETFYKAYEIAISGEPGPVFIEVPVNIQLYKASVEQPKTYDQFKTEQASHSSENTEIDQECIERSVSLLLEANSPGIFFGLGCSRCITRNHEDCRPDWCSGINYLARVKCISC
jgi:acetolactate synthase-1/2/3 large subunit